MNNSAKIGIAISCLIFSLGVFHTHLTGSIYYGLPISATIVVLTITALYLHFDSNTVAGVLVLAKFAVLYRVYSYLWPESMMRFDPDRHAVKSLTIIKAGDFSPLVDRFYSKAAGFQTFGAEAAMIADIPIDVAYAFFAVIVPACMVLFTAILARIVAEDRTATLVAAAIASVCGTSLQFSMAPIPMALAAVFVAGVVLAATLSGQRLSVQAVVVILVLMSAAAVTHKISVFLLVGFSGVLFVYSGIQGYVGTKEGHNIGGYLFVISLIVLTLQWLYFTDYLQIALEWIRASAANTAQPTGGQFSSTAISDVTTATAINPPLLTKIRNIIYYPLTVGTAAFAGLELFREWGNGNVRILQSAGVVMVAISIPGTVIDAAPGFQRVYLYGTVFGAALVGVGISRFCRSGTWVSRFSWPSVSSKRMLAGVLVVAILVANPLSSVASPDSPNDNREYLTAQEVAGKSFANERIRSLVYRDVFYQSETVDFERAANGPDERLRGIPFNLQRYGYLNRELLAGTLVQQRHKYVSIRKNMDVYRLVGGRYRLLWDPETAMNQSYNRIYDNGGVATFSRAGV